MDCSLRYEGLLYDPGVDFDERYFQQAFIKCMTDHDHEVTYGDMMAEMKYVKVMTIDRALRSNVFLCRKFFVRTNAERDVEDQFSLPPFPMLSSSYPIVRDIPLSQLLETWLILFLGLEDYGDNLAPFLV